MRPILRGIIFDQMDYFQGYHAEWNLGCPGGWEYQRMAILETEIPVREAAHRINETIIDMGFSTVMEIQEEMDKKGMELGHTYLQGPTPTTLRPRIITANHLTLLQEYSANLWRDLLLLEKMWKERKLDHIVQMGKDEEELARIQPWSGSPALVASDGLFSFGAHIEDD